MRWLAALVLVGAGCDGIFGLHELPPADAAGSADAPPASGTWQEVAAGEAHSCGIRLDGTLWCWGRNDNGQLAMDKALLELDDPVQVPGTWKHVALQYRTTCAIASDDTIWCWGYNVYGQAGSAGGGSISTPVQVSTDHFTALTAGYYFECGLRDDGAVLCWGFGGNGELGDGMQMSRSTPMPIDSTLTFTQIAAGSSHACAIASDKTLWCWGYGAYAQLGVGDTSGRLSPTLVPGGTWIAIAGGYYHSCGVLESGHLRCWGTQTEGQLGSTVSGYSLVPQIVGVDNDGWVGVAAAFAHSCATRTDGTLWCWGENDDYQLGTASAPAVDPVPTQITGGPASWLSLGLGQSHFCGVGDDHYLACTGLVAGGRIGDGSGSVRTPQAVTAGGSLIASGPSSTCTTDGTATRWCWGENGSLELGDGTTTVRDQPVMTGTGGDPIVLGLTDGCVLTGGKLECWGTSPNYEIDPMRAAHAIPTELDAMHAPFSAVALGNHTCTITTAGVLYCWGYNAHGEVGTGVAGAAVATPTQVLLPAQTWSSVAVGDYHTCGVGSGGVDCWGYNGYGVLGDGTTTDHALPGPVMTTLTTGTVYAIGDNSCLLSGTDLYCWGFSSNGELGGMPGVYTSPTLVPGAWRELALGRYHACAIATDGALWCWGYNAYGEVGDGGFADAHAPEHIGVDQWAHVAVGDVHTCAIRSDGAVFCWGANNHGQLGQPRLRPPFARQP
jgi:alpha-tubulin suppressor-like RCC1 family protein